jgi:DNA invertase Pin-like site-specific DNA recombinase
MGKSDRTRAIAYLRVSTDKQADKGVSLDAQRAKVDAYAALYEIDVVEVIVDAGASAKTLDRPGLARALNRLRKREADALLVVKLDRLTRSVRDLGELVAKFFAPGKAALLSVGEQIDTRSAAGRLVLNVLGSVSEWERDVVSERTSAAMQHKRACGEHTGGDPPFGYRVADDGLRIEPVAAEQLVIANARRLRASGLSLRAVARELDGMGHRSRVGRPFSSVQVRRMLRARPMMSGPPCGPTTSRKHRTGANADG